MRTEFSNEIIDQWKVIGPVMTALGSITRQRIIMLFEPGEQLNIKTIADQFNLSRTAVVHHIGVLQDAGILKGERLGKEVVMFVDWDLIVMAMDKIKSYIAAFGNVKPGR
jgi:predicted transcriptional regulator